MLDALRPVARPRLYEQLVDALLTHIDQTGLSTGDRLPPERELAQRLGVSRASVRQAIVALEVQGLVEVRHGDGMYLQRQPRAADLARELAERRRRLPDVLEARGALEVHIAALAAQRRTQDDLKAMNGALGLMADEIRDGRPGLGGDEAFHAAVTAAAHNPVLADLMAGLAHAIEETRRESLAQPGRPPRSLAGHRRIAAAIAAADVTAASAAMLEHLALVSDVALLRWAEEDLPEPGRPS
ncbi:MAG: FCD domain-containing protein [Actinomycetota bacterium]|nr:FCD domain-containing protein [Actinomycetota bacterium]